ncbi:MAG: Spi family protease inhibitor [Paludibacteraceae bacterium]|nr:Spi family protease inhibitor [Paludibacteraceae bacterium]
MKRLFFTIISVVMFFIDANGAKVKIETARQEAISFFAKKGYNHSSDSVFSVENDVDEFYIFYNAKKDYVIVSGSDKTRHSVLGYGSNFTGINNMSPALKLILTDIKSKLNLPKPIRQSLVGTMCQMV